MFRNIGLLILVFLLISLVCCSKSEQNSRLHHIASIVSDNPREALSSLDSIDRNSLNKDDQYYYDFLTIKANDKAYVTHTNDSLYLRVLDYYSDNKDSEIYPEVLYYGGRVYSDLGDYPTALNFFQRALDIITEGSNHTRLKSLILNQSAEILNSLRLYGQASCRLKQALVIDSIANDSIGVMYIKQKLGAIYLHDEKYDSAEIYINQSRNIAEKISPIDITQKDVYLATIYSKTNRHNLAKSVIQSIFEKNKIEDLDNTIANASGIYYRAEVYDTAFLYVTKLITLKNPRYLKYALSLALSPELINFVPKDSVMPYVWRYQTVTENEFNKNAENEALIQNTHYNYAIHDRERAKKEKENERLRFIVGGGILLILILSVLILYLKYRNKNNLIKLYEYKDKLQILQKSLNIADTVTISAENEEMIARKASKKVLRDKISKELLALQKTGESNYRLDPKIESSDLYQHLKKLILTNEIIKNGIEKWDELERLIDDSYPSFFSNLKVLSDNTLKPIELHIAMLIKCGFSPSEVAYLISKDKGTISYHRRHLSNKLFKTKLIPDDLNNAIRAL